MKKNYTTPTIEKIAFRYRDQVVAASGDNVSDPNSENTSGSWGTCFDLGDFGKYLFEAVGICEYIPGLH